MINIELAKELKEAGFPRGTQGKTAVEFVDVDGKHYFDIYIPTLSELIEACGDDFGVLEYCKEDKEWSACNQDREFIQLAETRDEAVAKLYIVLHEKDKYIVHPCLEKDSLISLDKLNELYDSIIKSSKKPDHLSYFSKSKNKWIEVKIEDFNPNDLI